MELTGEEAALANRITAIDLALNGIEHRAREIAQAMRGTGSFVGATGRLNDRDRRDQEHQRLLQERADLVEQLKRLDGDA